MMASLLKIPMKSMNRSNEWVTKSLLPNLRFSIINCVSYKTNPHMASRPKYKCAWYKSVDPKNKLANESTIRVLNSDISVPPRYRYFPRSARRAQMENEMKTSDVPIRAVTIMLGSTLMMCSRRGPIPTPLRAAKPRR